MKQTIRAASVQFEHSPGDKNANLQKIRKFTEMAAGQGVEIIAFPECCITGYWFLRNLTREQMLALAEPADSGPSFQYLKDLSARHGITIGAGLLEKTPDGKLYKAYAVAMPDGGIKIHRKIHAFVSEYLEPGTGYTVFDTPQGCRVGVLICYDNNIIENVRATAPMGAQILLAPHQTGGCRSNDPNTLGLIDRSLWENRRFNPSAIEAEFKGLKGREWLLRWLPSRAHDNGIFILFSNGVGVDDDEIRTGNAMILDPYGRILAETWKADDDMVIADLYLPLIEESTGNRWIRTRKPEMYAPLAVPTGRERAMRDVRFDSKGV